MGNASLFSCGLPSDPHGLLCRRACGLEELDADLLGCDPAGVVFDDTVGHLSELDQMTFKFAGSSNLAALRWLFVFGASHEACDSAGTGLLHVACRTGSLHTVKDLVRRGLPVNAVDGAGWTALHVASCMGRQDVSLYLLESGAEAQLRNGRGQTPEELCSHPWTKEVVVMYKSQSKAKPPRVGFPSRGPGEGGGGPAGGYAASSHSRRGPVDRGPTEFAVSLHFEPFFVPRDAILHEPRHREDLQRLGVHLFNRSPGHGLAFLVAAGAVRDYPVEINNFLVRVGADPVRLGEFLGSDFPISQTLRLEFLNSLPLLGTGVVSALETAFHEMAVPGDWVKADRLTRGVAHFWWRQHEEEAQEGGTEVTGGCGSAREVHGVSARGELVGLELQRCLLGTDALHRLMFSALKLNQWLSSGKQMSFGEWAQLNTGIECNGNDVPMHVQTGIYKALTEGRVGLRSRSNVDYTVAMAPLATIEGWAYVQYSGRAQTAQGTDPAAWPDASPRLLAEEGGATSAGRSAPLPGPAAGGASNLPDVPQPSLVATDAARAANDFAAAAAAAAAAGGASSTELAAVSSLSHPFDAKGTNETVVGGGEAAWLSLHKWILLLSSATSDVIPYAFVSLRQAIIKESEPVTRRVVLASRTESNWSPLAVSEDEWLDLCLLLGDGRFQALEAPLLELKFTSDSDFQSWSLRLGDLCHDDQSQRSPVPKAGDQKLPTFITPGGLEDAATSKAPLQPVGDRQE